MRIPIVQQNSTCFGIFSDENDTGLNKIDTHFHPLAPGQDMHWWEHTHLEDCLDVVFGAVVQLGDPVLQPLLHHGSLLSRAAQQLRPIGLLDQVSGDGH